ncbi:hypothetical protein Leryth_020252 [Lithospermum erythrorhizon]|nr:hypothetical protein Leryth_020252 [Lithospermum erythrorhizon]
MSMGSNNSDNTWVGRKAVRRMGGMSDALSIASDLGYHISTPPLQEEIGNLSTSNGEKGEDLIRVLRELTSVQRKIADLQVELQGRKEDKNVSHLTHVSEMQKKIETLSRITAILKDVIQNKDRIIARLQQPYSLDCIPVEAEYQKQFSELLMKAASDYGTLTASGADFQWTQNFKEPPSVWGEMLRPIPVALASCTRFFEAMSAMRESFSTLQNLRVGHSSSLATTPPKGDLDSECMTPLVTATKLAGVLVSVTVAANVFSFSRYRNKNLKPFNTPIHESEDVLAAFNVNPSDDGEDGFFFGLATAPAHVEDNLDDAWVQFAEENPCEKSESNIDTQPADALLGAASGDGGSQQASLPERQMKRMKPLKLAMEAKIRGFKKFVEVEEPESHEECHHNVAAWHNVPNPKERLRFWSDPDKELKLAKDTGVQVFRMGVDWTRIMPVEPLDGLKESVNYAALERYKWIISRVRSYGMKVMLTLFHHSLPPWAGEYGGWKLEKTVDYFMDFTRSNLHHSGLLWIVCRIL